MKIKCTISLTFFAVAEPFVFSLRDDEAPASHVGFVATIYFYQNTKCYLIKIEKRSKDKISCFSRTIFLVLWYFWKFERHESLLKIWRSHHLNFFVTTVQIGRGHFLNVYESSRSQSQDDVSFSLGVFVGSIRSNRLEPNSIFDGDSCTWSQVLYGLSDLVARDERHCLYDLFLWCDSRSIRDSVSLIFLQRCTELTSLLSPFIISEFITIDLWVGHLIVEFRNFVIIDSFVPQQIYW